MRTASENERIDGRVSCVRSQQHVNKAEQSAPRFGSGELRLNSDHEDRDRERWTGVRGLDGHRDSMIYRKTDSRSTAGH